MLPTIVPDCKGTECNGRDFLDMVGNLIKFLIGAVVSGSVLVFAWAGFMYMTAAGDTNKIQKAHGIFRKVIIGLLLALTAWLIVSTILKVLTKKGDLNEYKEEISAVVDLKHLTI